MPPAATGPALAVSSTGLRSQTRAVGGGGSGSQRERMLRENNPSVATRGLRGCAACLSCGCVRKRVQKQDVPSDMPSALTLRNHIHDPMDNPKSNANGTIRAKNTRSKEAVRNPASVTAALALPFYPSSSSAREHCVSQTDYVWLRTAWRGQRASVARRGAKEAGESGEEGEKEGKDGWWEQGQRRRPIKGFVTGPFFRQIRLTHYATV
jgi:hypothetical protein